MELDWSEHKKLEQSNENAEDWVAGADVNHNVVALLYLHLYIWSSFSMALCSSLWQTPAQAALWKVSMGIAFEEITFDSNLQWSREWQLCICLETNAKNI